MAWRRALLAGLCAGCAQFGAAHPAPPPPPGLADPAPFQAGPAAGPALQRLYQLAGGRALWSGPRAANAAAAVALLQDAEADGLRAAHYDLAWLSGAVRDGPRPQHAELETRLSSAMLRFLTDLHYGRVKPDFPVPPGLALQPSFDPAALLAGSIEAGQVAALAERARPQLPLYGRVRASLARYRVLAGAPQAPLAPPARGHAAQLGQPYPAAPALAARLALLGDLEAGHDSGGRFTAALEQAVRRFQQRHGIAVDGIPGPATLAALAVPLAHRVRQLELTLERIRWLPRLAPGRLIVVNIPVYQLWALDTAAAQDAAPLEMRVIVGQAGRRATPLFVGQLRHVEFNPYWNVPRSIALAEIAPRLAADPSYLARHDMELVADSGALARLGGGAAAAALRAGAVRLRQRPGPRNVLGSVKFAMPNPMNIYLHSTSSTELFDRPRRDLSHGCIRVEQPQALAAFVLAGTPGWDQQRVAAALAPGPMRMARLERPLPVLLLYATAVTRRDGQVRFAEDIYKRDRALMEQLGRAPAEADPSLESSAPD